MKSFLANVYPSKWQISSIGSLMLFLFWLFGYDGITFSDDVYYILAGKEFWNGTMEVGSYHFSSRWGAYVPAGFFSLLFDWDIHWISLVSFLSYWATYYLLLQFFTSKNERLILTLWFLTHVYFLHFLTKIYPDSLLVLWCTLFVAAASLRFEKPFISGISMVFALFMGFITKETIVFLAPFPILLFFFDFNSKPFPKSFYITLVACGITAGLLYLGYFWAKFGDPFYRVTSINAGHYVSEFTYADKGISSIIKRITYSPFLTFIERAYWPWIVFAIPGFWKLWKERSHPEFTLAFICLILGFWFMSSTLEFYNPIYLNPRHLIILIPFLSFFIAKGWDTWINSFKWKQLLANLLLLGLTYSAITTDWKMAFFQLALGICLWIQYKNFRLIGIAILLLFPAIYSFYYQHQIKQYQSLLNQLYSEVEETAESPILINNFLDFSKKILLEGDSEEMEKLIPIEKADSIIALKPEKIRLFLYQYYQHAYPKEEVDVSNFENAIPINYSLESSKTEGLIETRTYTRKD
ncbi:hypothetical protein SAMN04488519_10648 [Algoriphagus ornithinivorans]|uniref:4-amino-4-deoxy-L-arabinose transferase n=1 Tax=Algoriphagus ornithinivorans TaxID=226506 RepID=A0A1I5GSM9_9BACT|nr:hypothetical protein [Algoriphagus ornithinivorans]SFO39054.1 hypothetical protein SAMN04488519_10648 [Algoriphagus ornithinivorans]